MGKPINKDRAIIVPIGEWIEEDNETLMDFMRNIGFNAIEITGGKMTICLNCGVGIIDEAEYKFCPICGAKLEVTECDTR